MATHTQRHDMIYPFDHFMVWISGLLLFFFFVLLSLRVFERLSAGAALCRDLNDKGLSRQLLEAIYEDFQIADLIMYNSF